MPNLADPTVDAPDDWTTPGFLADNAPPPSGENPFAKYGAPKEETTPQPIATPQAGLREVVVD